MLVQNNNYHKLCYRLALLFVVSTLLTAGCTTIPNQSSTVSTQSSNGVPSRLSLYFNEFVYSEWTLDNIESELLRLKAEGKLREGILAQNLTETARVLLIAKYSSVSNAILTLSQEQPERALEFIQIALNLYPQNKTEVLVELWLDSQIEEEAIYATALELGLSLDDIFGATAGGKEYSLVPLINSVSITIYNRDKNESTNVQYRKISDEEWSDGLPLYWEPIQGAFSGSIVHLSADTEYEIKVVLADEALSTEVKRFTFTTKPNSPPINPELVYKISDIYTGGQLNLDQLGISGTEDGWAKIVGDGIVEIVAGPNDNYAINIGNAKYVMFENIVVKGGGLHGVYGNYAHHIWFDGCDISEWGRVPRYFKEGIGYEDEKSSHAINYDAGIALRRTGSVVVENCKIHSPNGRANHWGYGHPRGPSAMLILATHPNPEFAGQYIIRNNKFFGAPNNRYNDVIESRANGRVWGGFVRDSAIHDNYFAFANDDIVELDGGQSNVLFYNNEIEQGFCGVSAIPNMLGPSYIFNNYIHNLGDERQRHWGAIKLGGLLSRPAGIVNIFHNLVVTDANGLVPAGFAGDSTYWVHAQNNIFIHGIYREIKGYSIHDPNKFPESRFVNNLMFNTSVGYPVYNANINLEYEKPAQVNLEVANDIADGHRSYFLDLSKINELPNFTLRIDGQGLVGAIPN